MGMKKATFFNGKKRIIKTENPEKQNILTARYVTTQHVELLEKLQSGRYTLAEVGEKEMPAKRRMMDGDLSPIKRFSTTASGPSTKD